MAFSEFSDPSMPTTMSVLMVSPPTSVDATLSYIWARRGDRDAN